MWDKGAIQDSRHKVLGVFERKVKGVEAVAEKVRGNIGRRTW